MRCGRTWLRSARQPTLALRFIFALVRQGIRARPGWMERNRLDFLLTAASLAWKRQRQGLPLKTKPPKPREEK